MGDIFKNMFRDYDIRGRVDKNVYSDENDEERLPSEMNENNVERIAKGFASFLTKIGNPKEIIVGYDNRSYSPGFAEAARKNLAECGFKVYDIGLSLSPVTYFAQHYLKCPNAVMITASHNPNGWSGLKLAQGLSKTLGPDEIIELYKIIINEDFVKESGGSIEKREDIRDAYINDILEKVVINKENAPKVVLDAGNGGAGLFAYELFQKLGCVTFHLNCDPDTSYPHYDPNPSNLKARKRLKEMVTHPYINADLGIGFDGDGDRIGVIDQNGENIWSDKILMILAKQLLDNSENTKIVFDVKSTRGLYEIIERNGGKPVLCKTGHSHIKSKMHEIGAELAGERSGHIFINYGGFYGYDDALLAAAKLIEYISYSNKSITRILEDFPRYVNSPEIKAHCADGVKKEVVKRLVEEFKAQYGDKVDSTDGARVDFGYGWGLVRASANLPELSIVFEAEKEEQMMEIRKIFKEILGKHKEINAKWENDIV